MNTRYQNLIAQAILDQSDSAWLLFSYEPDGLPTLRFANRAFGELAGTDPHKLLNSSVNLLGGLHYRENPPYQIEAALERGEEYRQEMLLSRSDGSTFWGDVRIQAIREPEQKTPYILTTLTDITSRKKGEARLKKAEEEAEESRRARERFVASMSHEIRTPMTGVIGMTELLADTDLNQSQREYLESIRTSAGSLVQILNDVIEFSSVVSDNIQIEHKPFRIREVFRHLKTVYQYQTEKQNILFEVNHADDLPELLIGDEKRFLQILMQLVGNAFKFTDSGFIRVNAFQQEVNHGMIRIAITIEDSGIGIPDELAQTIYESFSKASKSTMSRYGGTGLGLAIVKHLTGLMDGRIEIESQENRGTTCTITLPFELQESSRKEIPVEKTAPEKARPVLDRIKHALVVDDHPVNRRLLEGMLKRAGIEMSSAEDGYGAIELLRKETFDFILMDVHMPGMSGLDTTRWIRTELDEPGRHVPVIAVTASTTNSDIELCREAGMNEFLAKPFSFDELITKIVRVCSQGREEDHLQSKTDSLKSPSQDLPRFAGLIEMTAGDPDMMREMLELFLEQTPGMIRQLRSHFTEQKWAELGRIAHTLKPTFSYLGIDEAHPLLLRLESCKDTAPGPDEIPEVETVIQDLERIAERTYRQAEGKVSELKQE